MRKNDKNRENNKLTSRLPVDNSEYGDSEKQKFESAQLVGRPGDQMITESPASDYGFIGKTQLKGAVKASKIKNKKTKEGPAVE